MQTRPPPPPKHQPSPWVPDTGAGWQPEAKPTGGGAWALILGGWGQERGGGNTCPREGLPARAGSRTAAQQLPLLCRKLFPKDRGRHRGRPPPSASFPRGAGAGKGRGGRPVMGYPIPRRALSRRLRAPNAPGASSSTPPRARSMPLLRGPEGWEGVLGGCGVPPPPSPGHPTGEGLLGGSRPYLSALVNLRKAWRRSWKER